MSLTHLSDLLQPLGKHLKWVAILVRKGCRLSWLTNSALVCEPKCRGRVELRGLSQWVHLYTWSPIKLWRSNSIFKLYTDKKENRIFLTYKEIQSGPVAKSYMRKGGFLRYEEMRKYFPIYEEAGSHIWLCNCLFRQDSIEIMYGPRTKGIT